MLNKKSKYIFYSAISVSLPILLAPVIVSCTKKDEKIDLPDVAKPIQPEQTKNPTSNKADKNEAEKPSKTEQPNSNISTPEPKPTPNPDDSKKPEKPYVDPTKDQLTFQLSNESIIDDRMAELHIEITDDNQLLNMQSVLEATLDNNQTINGLLMQNDNNHWVVTFAFNLLEPSTKYKIKNIRLINKTVEKEFTLVDQLSFETFATIPNVINVIVNNNDIFLPTTTNNFQITFDKIRIGMHQSLFHLVFINKVNNKEVMSNNISLDKERLIYDVNVSGFDDVGNYQLEKISFQNNDQTWTDFVIPNNLLKTFTVHEMPQIVYNLELIPREQSQINITPNNARYDILINDPDHELTDSSIIQANLKNKAPVNAVLTKNSDDSWTASFEFTDLFAHTTYNIEQVVYQKDNIEYVLNKPSTLSFTTEYNPLNITNASFEKTTLTNNDQQNTLRVDLSEYQDWMTGQPIVAVLTHNDKQISSIPIILKNQETSISFIFNNLVDEGEYIFKHLRVNNDSTKTYTPSTPLRFCIVRTTQTTNLPYSSKTTAEYGNVNRLQQANDIVDSDIGLTDISHDEITLKQRNNSYSIYFDALKTNYNYPVSNDAAPENQEVSKKLKITSIQKNNNNIVVNFNSEQNVNINSARVLIKSYDHHNPWSKWINTTINDNTLTFSSNELTKQQSKFVITNIEINDADLVQIDFSKNNTLDLNPHLETLSVNDFVVSKDETQKTLTGSLSLTWNVREMEYYKNKVFALVFETIPKTFVPNKGLFGDIRNNHENFDSANAVKHTKKILVNFSDLHSFSLASLQEQIKYKLVRIEVLQPNSYVDYIQPINPSQNYIIAYNFNWKANAHPLIDQLYVNNELSNNTTTNYTIKKQDIYKSKSPMNISYSPANLSTFLDYKLENTAFAARYPNHNYVPKNIDITINKNGVAQDVKWFMTRNYIVDTMFKFNEDKNLATITRDLNTITNLDDINDEDVIFWFVFELDPNPITAKTYQDFTDIHSRIRIPVSLKNIKENNIINDVDFLFDYVAENDVFQQNLAAKIRGLVQFNLVCDPNSKILTLQVQTRDPEVKMTNHSWVHNVSANRSIFLQTGYFFVAWVQPKTSTKDLLGFKENKRLDDLSILGTTVAYQNNFNLITQDINTSYSDGPNKSISYINEAVMQPNVPDDQIGKRLYKNHTSKGLIQARKRVYSLNNKSDGTWNIFGKVSSNPNDYRFWTFANYHVWDTNRSPQSGIAIVGRSAANNQTLEIRKPRLMAPTLVDEKANEYGPIYQESKFISDYTPVGYLFDFDIPENLPGIKYELIRDFSRHENENFGVQRDNEGFEIKQPNNDSRVDIVMAIVDFSPIFTTFKNVDLDTYMYTPQNGGQRHLTDREKNAIKYFLSFKDTDVINMSSESRFMSSVNNLNFYIGSLPKVQTHSNPDGKAGGGRYREYLYAYNNIKVKPSVLDEKTAESTYPAVWSETRLFDFFSGSSGSGVYDYEGKLIGFNVQGSPVRQNAFNFLETQPYSFFGDETTIYNPATFYETVKRLSYWYPNDYQDLFSK
ncbi:hypothetical protein OF377_01705 [Ureaplasma sp. ES3154-GEN]|uniref:hypothetical protein n=1 Tax=Ureaplasma sp. ES3154-GEN TaxID=2984844 RepID=UPI0021E7184D|nr:hypothetical protein [Ureaplasma sp. ES3154-GEN]MCV3743602.1 hypothetical protein [Ureaplasma sp. ES3154-GEN]